MEILLPPEEGASPYQLGIYRYLRVMLWLHEFHISSVPLLARLVGLPPSRRDKRTCGLFQRMADMQLIVLGKHPAFRQDQLVMAGPAASQWIWRHGFDLAFNLNEGLMQTHRQLLHDLSVQAALIKRIESAVEILGEHQLVVDKSSRWLAEGGERMNKPDALIRRARGGMLAIEYEMTRKAKGRIYQAFQSHALALHNKLYQGVVYLFPNEGVMKSYVDLFNEPLWPIYTRDRLKGHVVMERGVYTLDKDHRSKGFRFMVENYYQAPTPARRAVSLPEPLPA